jgi:HD-like signal output (HDOD) protein
MRRILFVDDQPQILEGLRDALRACRREWTMSFADGGAAALRELETADFDVVVSDMRMPGMDGADLLSAVRDRRPGTVRIVLSGYAEDHVIMRAAPVAHRFLGKPCDINELRRIVERSCELREMSAQEQLRLAATSALRLPALPALYSRVTRLLQDPDASLRDVAALVDQDIAIAARILQLANSAFFGRTRRITRLDEAVAFIGLTPLRALILSAEAFETLEPSGAVGGFSIAALQLRAQSTARLARSIADDPEQRDDAFCAGLLHDLGMLVLASMEPEHVATSLAIAARDGRRLDDVERELRGSSHAEVGAHLLELWGLPDAIVEAVAYHHRPAEAHDAIFDVTAVVAIADALLEELDDPSLPPPAALDAGYLERIGVTDRLPGWREQAKAIAAGQPL